MGGGKNKKKTSKGPGGAPTATFTYDEAPSVDVDPNATPAELKARGNASVQAGDHAVALELFTLAIAKGADSEDLHVFYSNRSLCALTLKKFDMATADAGKCVELKPEWSKV